MGKGGGTLKIEGMGGEWYAVGEWEKKGGWMGIGIRKGEGGGIF